MEGRQYLVEHLLAVPVGYDDCHLVSMSLTQFLHSFLRQRCPTNAISLGSCIEADLEKRDCLSQYP